MKFFKFFFNKTAIYLAVERRDMDIINLLISYKDLDINAHYILKFQFLLKLIRKYFNYIYQINI